MSENIRTRFAPSPTGYLHVGGARTALFNYLYARAKKGKFILRIEDTDQARSTQESYNQMIESMKWLGLDWDEGPELGGEYEPYKQSERLDIYKKYIHQLIEEDKAYYCFCSSEKIDKKREVAKAKGEQPIYDGECSHLTKSEVEQKLANGESHVVRLRSKVEEIQVNDMVQGEVTFNTAIIGDFILLKSDGFPSYNFAVVIDDALMKISHVIRGVGHLSNTPKQIMVYRSLGFEEPLWAHVSEIVGSDHKKLSKRHGATAITAFRDMGYSSQAFLNFMSLLGWMPKDEVEYMSKERIIEQFDVAKCSKSPSMFDVFDLKKIQEDAVNLNELSSDELLNYLSEKSKLNWLSNLTIRDMNEDEYIEAVWDFIEDIEEIPEEEKNKENISLRNILLSLRVYLNNLSDIKKYLADFYIDFEPVAFLEEEKSWLSHDFSLSLVQKFYELLQSFNWEITTDLEEQSKQIQEIKNLFKKTGKEVNQKGKNLFMTLRVATTGKVHGQDLAMYIYLLGKEKVLNRLQKVIDYMN